jgi:hypothetical protein
MPCAKTTASRLPSHREPGPVGLTLSIDLGWRSVRYLIMDRSPTTLPRAEVVQISAWWDRRVLAELRLRLDWAWYSLIRENSSALFSIRQPQHCGAFFMENGEWSWNRAAAVAA